MLANYVATVTAIQPSKLYIWNDMQYKTRSDTLKVMLLEKTVDQQHL